MQVAVVSSRDLRCKGSEENREIPRVPHHGTKCHVDWNSSCKPMVKIKNDILTPPAQLKYFDKNNNNKLYSTQKINSFQQSDRRVHSLHCTRGHMEGEDAHRLPQ